MPGPNGHAHESDKSASVASSAPLIMPTMSQFSAVQIKELVAELEVPFDASQIEWRVMNTTKGQQGPRGQIVPYADQRAYTDRLNALFSPAGWTRKYLIHTSANFERSKDQKIVAKVLVTCELTIFGLGSHSATGEEWADDDNAGTAAEARAFKRACACFGLGRYLYYFSGSWVDLDDRKRPKSVPQLAGWATPAGWRTGLRPGCAHEPSANEGTVAGNGADRRHKCHGTDASDDLLREIEGLERVIGKRMYRGLLKSVARVWNPKDIPDQTIQKKVLAHMQAAERGLGRAQVAVKKAGAESLAAILKSTNLRSLDQVDNLQTLQEIVLALEAGAFGNK